MIKDSKKIFLCNKPLRFNGDWSKYLCVATCFSLSFFPFLSHSQSISEKKATIESSETGLDQETEARLKELNQKTEEIHATIARLYQEALALYQAKADPEEYHKLLDAINDQKSELALLEISWRETAKSQSTNEEYGLWHAPDTTLEQLVIDYGSREFVYLIPPEVADIKLSINSNLPIPRASWNEMLELILAQNGVGVRQLNPYLRQLFLAKDDNSHLSIITNRREDIAILPSETRVGFILSPGPSEVKRTYSFLEKFINPNTTSLQALGRDILVVGSAGEVLDLLRLNDFISHNRGEKEYRVLSTYKLPPEEMAKILAAVFDQSDESFTASTGSNTTEGGKRSASSSSSIQEMAGLKIIPMPENTPALLVVGSRDEIQKAEEVVRNVETQIGGARDKVVFWYTVQNSETEELADVLYRVYALMMTTNTGQDGCGCGNDGQPKEQMPPGPLSSTKEPPPLITPQESTFYQEGGYVVNPAPSQPRSFEPTVANNNRDNFIVDVKTGSIVMVVESDVLPKIKELIRKLDVPKKMVQIETLLFEKILKSETSVGLNLLKIGDAAMNKNATGLFFNNLFPHHSKHEVVSNEGVTEFFLSRKQTDSGIPAFDMVYRFLLNQDNVQVNCSPSILTVNQTPATIAINEEISINTGVYQDYSSNGNVSTPKDAFTRAQYGITISIKPTIHLADPDQDYYDESKDADFVTLETDITFDTINPSHHSDRPDVTRRHITNSVQVPDGDTVIIGGLRRKVSSEKKEGVPFLGELPGLGKLFSITSTHDANTEMFFLITPHVVKDPKEQLACLQRELMAVRPGDVPYFLNCVQESFLYEKNKLMAGSMTILCGQPKDHYYMMDNCNKSSSSRTCCQEYDGR